MTEHSADDTNQCQALGKDTPGVVKPCVLHLIRTGTEYCQREAALAIVFELRRLKVAWPVIVGVLMAWNTRNDPPMVRTELRDLIDVVYDDQEYEFDCEMLREILPPNTCAGSDRCLYIDLLLELEMRGMKRSGKKRKKRKRPKCWGQKKGARGSGGKGTASGQKVLFPDSC